MSGMAFPSLRSPFYPGPVGTTPPPGPSDLSISVSDSITVSESFSLTAPFLLIELNWDGDIEENIGVTDGSHLLSQTIADVASSGNAVAGGTAGSGELNQALAQQFVATGVKLSRVQLALAPFGTPTDNFTVDIVSTLGGSSLGSATLSAATIIANDGVDSLNNFVFSSPIILTNGGTYYIQMTRSGARDETNLIGPFYTESNVYVSGDTYGRHNNVWSADGDVQEFYFVLEFTDDLKVELNSNISKSESISVSENVQIFTDTYNLSTSDSITVSENTSLTVSAPQVNKSDSITVSESVALSIPINLAVSDSIAVSENVAIAITGGDLPINVSDTITVSESTKFLLESYINKSDSITVSENTILDLGQAFQVSDSITISESLTLITSDPQLTVSDSIATSESVVVGLEININTQDTISVTESVAGLTSDPQISVSDTITVSESLHNELEGLVNVEEDITVTENVEVSLLILINVQDSITVTENVQGITSDPQITVSDSISVTDSPTVYRALVDLNLAVSDTITLTEFLVVPAPFYPQPAPLFIMDDLGNIYIRVVDRDPYPIYKLV